MTSEDLNSLFLLYQFDGDLLGFSDALSMQPPDCITSSLGKQGDGAKSLRHAEGPRGGRKRVRVRQQQLNTLEAELQQKLRDLEAAQQERERLQQRIKVLELTLPLRERHVKLLRQRRHAAQAVPPAHIYKQDGTQHTRAHCNTELRTAAPRDGSSSGSETRRATDEALRLSAPSAPTSSPAAVAGAAGASQRPAGLALPIQSSTDPVKVDSYADAFTSGWPALITAVPAHNRVPCQAFQEFCGVWKQWVMKSGLILHAHDARPHDPGPQLKLSQLFEQLAPRFDSLRLEHPSLFTEMMYVNLETGEREEPPPDSYWIPVAQGLRLSPEQVADAKAILALYSGRAAGAQEERRRLTAQLGSSLASLQGMVPLHGHGAAQQPAAVKRGQLVVEVDELAARLYRNVMVQGSALEFVKDFMGSKLLSLVQLVRVSVLSYPYIPDVIGILSSLDATPPCPARQP
ncbi:hypothetical protein PLESTB_000972300 [Pleodorina starrii]|uniref:Uncharacterized protein n=1 Tax=Pleodorina starrii TaxID=330485 RepID=A0A9W6F4F7_9CHLO|nr:hypothetical protein PLESTM_001634200 [Pleodorina starrii]GLC55321.1 hypothetical protein PLESTB_000972300 [Pleodorina starrii]GLC76314.1 hypothetical protein PLESTF_001765600 [Pleodorina starrii]